MVHRYVPILRWKRGEKIGTQRLSGGARNDVVPLFVLGTQQYVGRKATASRATMTPPYVFAAELSSVWGNAPFYLDAAALLVGAGGHHPLNDIAARARATGLHLIPSTRLDAPAPYQAAVNAVAATDYHGVALVVDLNEFAATPTWAAAWPHAPADTDLIVDFADNVTTVDALGAAINPVFQGLHHGNQWRTVTMCGTSMPENFTGYVAGQHRLRRTEVALWQRLSALALPYRLDYGDYATVAVIPPPSGIRWGFPINVRYTLTTDFFICRGVNTTGPGAVDMDVQLVGHANAIRAYATRGPLPACWSDTKIDRIAAGTDAPQGLEHWVQIGVNRHIEVTRHHLP